MNLPCTKSPCGNCPFRKDSQKGWLGEDRIKEILKSDSFVCHKNNSLQCSGHMHLLGNENAFVDMARRLNIDPKLKNRDLVFETKEDCINHHKN